MRTKPPILLAVLAIAAAPVWATPQAAPATTGQAVTPWQTVAASGPVQARLGDEPAAWRDISRGDALSPSTLVQTGRKGRATLTRNASLVILDPQSSVELPGEGLGGLETSVVQTEGSVLYKVDGRSNPHFEVVTPFLVAGVKGTSFLVTVNERYAAVTVEHGLVEITNPSTGDVLELGPGETVLRQRDAIELELVRDDQRSREARHEARRLERMDDATDRDALRATTDGQGQGDMDSRLALEDATGDFPGIADGDGPGAQPASGASGMSAEDISNEMIEEMIREGIHDGAIGLPILDPVPLPGVPDPGQPTGPGGGNGSADDPVFIQPN